MSTLELTYGRLESPETGLERHPAADAHRYWRVRGDGTTGYASSIRLMSKYQMGFVGRCLILSVR